MEQKKKLMSFTDFASGSIAGIVQVLLGQPFDIIKVRMQTSSIATSPFQIAKDLLKNEGALAFYNGTLSPLIGISICVAVQFGSNESAKNYLMKQNLNKYNSSTLYIKDYVLAGIFAGFMNSLVISPVELFRIKMQVQNSTTANAYTGTVDCAKKIFQQYGIKGVYQGYSATLFREAPAYAVYFGVYESLMAKSEKKYNKRNNIPLLNVMSYGAISGVLLWLATFPNDVIKSRMQADDINNRRYPSIMKTINIINAEAGLMGFFKGLTPCLMRAPPINAATFLTFEIVQKLLRKD